MKTKTETKTASVTNDAEFGALSVQLTNVYITNGLNAEEALNHLTCYMLEVLLCVGVSEAEAVSSQGKHMQLTITDVSEENGALN